MLVKMKRAMVICVCVSVLLPVMWFISDATGEQAGYGRAKYHETHLKKVGLHCEYCHVNPYKPTSWIEVDKKGVIIATEPTNSKRRVDKEKCLECHRWDPRPWYGPLPADAGSLYK